jgi:uncharacterized membrane protein YphA (DoxX/SURF4 family)
MDQELPRLVAAGAGVILLVGFWTPIAGVVVSLLELWLVLARSGDLRVSMLAAAIASGLAMLGPGAWSVDALRFGRKRISIREQ